ncbi:ATP-binding protein [Winogradskyella bathintestinalis]|uniref:histidine kinase n=1 Tax=Winogradskyella bathintestinalis TaxID=3035208 RepID=A0ABT7ZSC2_9FLAO|nr:ATP-binding protein [Winogradskyella bathintestinalis]MDN3491709.1 ATP-binding protein [Winogradskyella bathintestinalis]
MFPSLAKKELGISFFSFLLLNLIVLAIWSISINTQKLVLKNQVQISGQILTEKIHTIVIRDIQRLENLKDRFEKTDGQYFQYWEPDAEMILEQNQSFKFVEWIDSSMVIRKINPLRGNEAVIGLDISKIGYRKVEWLRHSKDGSTNITPWAKLTQGGHAFLVDVPVYFNNRFQGTITAGMDFKNRLDDFADNMRDYSIQLTDGKGTVFYQYNPILSDDINMEYHYKSTFTIDQLDQQEWQIKITPTSSSFFLDKSASLLNMLYFGIVLSTLMSLIIYFYLRAKKEASRTILINEELIKTNKKLNKERNRAEKASKAKTEFLSNMSHEIRTPLNAILGFIQLIKHAKQTSDHHTYLDLMDQSSKNLLALVDDVLDIDKIESRETKLVNVTFTPSKEIKAIVSQFIPYFDERNLKLNLELKTNLNANVIGDEGKFNQIIINLLKNALKFTDKGGVHVRYEEYIENGKLNVSINVSDTGIGIPKESLSRIFERFVQIDFGLKKKHSGSGLGLYISKNLANLMGGNITVESELLKGSEFTFSIPFTISNYVKEEDLSLNLNTTDLEHLHILIVDDNKINRLVLSKILEQLGITSDKANDGKEALEKATSHSYQLILMDIHMPILNGYEATKMIRNIDKDILIVGLSANVTKEAIEQSLMVGMNDYLTKPLSKGKLILLLNKYFSKS